MSAFDPKRTWPLPALLLNPIRWPVLSLGGGNEAARQAVNYLIGEAGRKAKLERVHPHKLRHSCGYYLANQGVDLRTMQDYLGHRDPRHTVLYTRVAGRRFEGLWK